MINVRRSFTIVEMLVVVAIIGILVAMLMPSLMKALDTARMVTCASNLKSINLAIAQYADDNSGGYPLTTVDLASLWRICPSNCGTNHTHFTTNRLAPYLGFDSTDTTNFPNNRRIDLYTCASAYSYSSPMESSISKGTVAVNIQVFAEGFGGPKRPSSVKSPSKLALLSDANQVSSGATWRNWYTGLQAKYCPAKYIHGGKTLMPGSQANVDYFLDGRGVFSFSDGRVESIPPEDYQINQPAAGTEDFVNFREFYFGDSKQGW